MAVHGGIVKMKKRAETPVVRAYHHGDLKNALIAAALKQIAARGPRALSLREVARAVGVSHASAYRHFPNKESVLATIAEQGFRGLSQAMHAAAQREGDVLKILHRVGVAYVEFGVSHPHHLQVMFGDFIVSHEAYPSLAEAGKEAYELLAGAVRAGQQARRIRSEDPQLVELAAWSQVHGLALLIASGQIPADGMGQLKHGELADGVLTLLQEGLSLKPTPGQQRRRGARSVRA
jgi:AcrR family transcriptional regulator